MSLSAKEQELVNAISDEALDIWKFAHRFVWVVLVCGIVIGAILEHFLRF